MLSPEALIGRAKALAPAIAAAREEADRRRNLSPEVVEQIRQADLFRLLQPARWGGFEADPRVFFDVQNAIAETCASTAWVFGVLSVQSFVLALFDAQAQADVWEKDGRALASSSFAPVGKAVPVEGGYRISGRWPFSSGSAHAQWALVGALTPSALPDGPLEARIFLMPRADYEIDDVWNTFGLRGTGSNDIVANDVFVPAYRTVKLDAGIINTPRSDRPGAPLYRMPWLYLFAGAISNFSIGAARGALRSFLDRARTRVAVTSGKVAKEDPDAQIAAAQLYAEIDTIEAMYRRHVERIMARVDADEVMDPAEGLLYRMQGTGALRKLTAHVDAFMLLLGGRAINLDSPITRLWLDLSAARAHPGNDPGIASSTLGRMLIEQGV